MSGFNFGADPVQSGGNLKQAAEGMHEARLLGMVHLGMYADTFNGKPKPPAPFVCALLELKSGEEEGGTNDDGTPIIVHKSFPLKKGDKAFLTGFMKAFLTKEEQKLYQAGALEGGFEDFIGRTAMVEMEGSKAKDDEGNPKYTNVKSISAMSSKLAKMCEELENTPIGHVTLNEMTEEALRALPPYEIYGKMELAINFPGSQAEAVLEKIRETDPEFGTKKEGDGDGKDGESKVSVPPETQRDDLDESEDFS